MTFYFGLDNSALTAEILGFSGIEPVFFT